MAFLLFAEGNYSEALKEFEAEAKKTPGEACCWCNVAATHLALELNRACIKVQTPYLLISVYLWGILAGL
jgi:hypothetical protein